MRGRKPNRRKFRPPELGPLPIVHALHGKAPGSISACERIAAFLLDEEGKLRAAQLAVPARNAGQC